LYKLWPFFISHKEHRMNELDSLIASAQSAFEQAATPADLENAKALFLGKTGKVTELMKGMAQLSVEEKKSRGAAINQAKQAIEAALNARRAALAQAELDAQLKAEALDVTLPGRQRGTGGLHPVTRAWERIEQIFGSMGFDVADGPEIESDWFNFTALNNPPNHPARSMQDTFYIDMQAEDGQPYCLRTHTSPMQIRYALAHAKKHAAALAEGRMPEIRVIAPGRTYRVDSDATHSPMFHFVQEFFEDKGIVLRFRPSFFPFTEPSAEMDIAFSKGPLAGRWLEVSGSGQVHPVVVRNMGLDPEKYIGFAFGSGIDRLAMLRYGVNDLRLFFDGDLRFLSQFA
jgi:phenylalanyl-tRNA synthetase alpha chain